MGKNFYETIMQLNKTSEIWLKNILTETNRMKEVVQEAVRNSNILEYIDLLTKGMEETEKDLAIFKSAMVELGYPPHGRISIQDMRHIANDFTEDKNEVKEYIDEFMTTVFDSKELNKMLAQWENSNILNKRMPLLRNAIMAHNLGMYDLVVPSVLSQLEGFLVDLFEYKGKVFGKTQLIFLKHLLLENRNEYSFDDAIHEFYSQQILESFEHGKETESGVSRHAILHGGETGFGKETISLKILLLFDYLHKIADQLTPEIILAAKEEISTMRNK